MKGDTLITTYANNKGKKLTDKKLKEMIDTLNNQQPQKCMLLIPSFGGCIMYEVDRKDALNLLETNINKAFEKGRIIND